MRFRTVYHPLLRSSVCCFDDLGEGNPGAELPPSGQRQQELYTTNTSDNLTSRGNFRVLHYCFLRLWCYLTIPVPVTHAAVC